MERPAFSRHSPDAGLSPRKIMPTEVGAQSLNRNCPAKIRLANILRCSYIDFIMHAHSDPLQKREFLPAAGKDWLLPLYDPFVKLLGGDAIRKKMIRLAELQAGQKVLEIGCGTGEVLLAIKRAHPAVEVTGLDPDPKALDRANRKSVSNKASMQLDQGFSDHLPYEDESFDRVVSSFMFHHLNVDERLKTLQEARRVLKSDGAFHLVDFEHSHGKGRLADLFHHHERLKDNSSERILTLLKEAGFSDVRTESNARLLVFPVAFYKARK
jgi:SAM-dependent methyltransferase